MATTTETTTDDGFTLIEHLPFTTAKVIGSRARIGLVVLASDYTIEHEFRTLVDMPGVDISLPPPNWNQDTKAMLSIPTPAPATGEPNSMAAGCLPDQ